MREKVSIVVPAYNAENTIEKCVMSIAMQDYPEKEIIVVNDGSADGTEKVLNELRGRVNELVVISKRNGGVSSARNAGINAATGRYLITIDGDDYIDPGMITALVDAMNCRNGVTATGYSSGIEKAEDTATIEKENNKIDGDSKSADGGFNKGNVPERIDVAMCGMKYVESTDKESFGHKEAGGNTETNAALNADCDKTRVTVQELKVTGKFNPPEEGVFSKREFLKKHFPKMYDDHLITTHSNKLYDLDIIRKQELRYDEGMKINEDIDFVFRYLEKCEGVVLIKGEYMNYVQHAAGESLVSTYQSHGLSSALTVIKDYYDLFGNEPTDEMNQRMFVHVLSFAGLMYKNPEISNDERKKAIEGMLSDDGFKRLVEMVKPYDLKTTAAKMVLRTGNSKLYHLMCKCIYR
ncbi:MAG: glycosyltransferase family 2 protein [Eubacteriales bacterium]|nr:glycosyltransferase family 2 protein [Eubacteriales bacterium]